MKKTIISAFALGSLLISCTSPTVNLADKVYNQGINIIPMPKELVVNNSEEGFTINQKTVLVAQGEEATAIAKFFSKKLNIDKITQEATSNAITLKVSQGHEGLNTEGYTLISTANGVEIIGASAQGLFWGMQSLLQLLPAEIESKQLIKGALWSIPAVNIKDEPAFGYRGMLIDVCRHFATVEEMKTHIDILSMFKINRLHWHLTEDQGWRIEIKKYPKLTEIGSKRVEYDGTEYGPFFYTQDEVREIVAYAAERFVTIIPEIELPGHAMGAITAYPELSCFPKTQKGSDYAVRNIWGIELDVYCPGKETTFEFLSDVIDEVAPLFPSEYFHIGGDECPKDRWKICPDCQRRIKSEGLKDEYELQSYTIRRAQEMLAKHGKKLIGWDEILEGGLAPSATVMSWRGEEGGIESANAGHDVIMTPGSGGLYIDHYQGDPKIEPVAICCYSPLEKVYNYYPIPEAISEDKRHHILGAQVNLWAEYLYTDALRQYRAYPRTIALAEAVWTPREKRNLDDFYRRINNAYVRLDQYGINYHIPLPEQPNGSCNFIAFTEETTLELTTSRPIKIVYTLDGSDPTPESATYNEPIKVTEDCVIKVASALPSGKLSMIRAITFDEQELAPSVEVSDLKEGLEVKRSEGKYYRASDLEGTTNWTSHRVDALHKVRPHGLHNNFDEFAPSASIGTGFILIPEDGVYFFSTNNDEFWIDGERLIDNAGEVKKSSRRDASRALKAGYHPIKVVFIGASHGGFPSYWDDAKVWIRPASERGFVEVKSFTGTQTN